jgi:acyl-CoA synthetase (AMP-forming)/AMP-acid ligase II
MGLGMLDRSVVAVPLSHVTGLIAQLCTMTLVHGTVILIDGFKAATFLPIASSERMTHTVMVPTMYQLCLMQPDLGAHDLSHWRIGAYGGAPMVPATISAIAKVWPGLQLMNAYGATETTSPATVMPPSDTAKRPDSVGLAVPCAELQVVDLNGQALTSGEIGEIWIRGPMVVKSYWDNPTATSEAFSNGFWRSGDIGRIDAEGYVQVLDRIKDVIIRGGYKVYSSEVEAVLLEHPAVVEAAIIGMPCDILGERVCAFVCLRALVSEKTLIDWCKARVSDYKVPEQWRMGTEFLPRNANGKLMKKIMRQAL